jgi:hypothetical protein
MWAAIIILIALGAAILWWRVFLPLGALLLALILAIAFPLPFIAVLALGVVVVCLMGAFA